MTSLYGLSHIIVSMYGDLTVFKVLSFSRIIFEISNELKVCRIQGPLAKSGSP